MVLSKCEAIDEVKIRQVRQRGLHNARMYMAMHDLDVYVATSMRTHLHFTSNWRFVQELFHSGTLEKWRLRYFDPTQAYLEDRVQKGLLECLMIKRAKLTIYNAQEEDTFGKDAEAGVTLAQGKPVIVYVARLFHDARGFNDLYRFIDEGSRIAPGEFLERALSKSCIRQADADELKSGGLTTGRITELLLRSQVRPLLQDLSVDHVSAELMRAGYEPDSHADPISTALDKIVRLERRALTFRDVHPLSLQTGPSDGVARGVMVTRSVKDTAELVRAILLGCLEYRIEEDEYNWLLVETISGSPVRVVTKDPLLTTAFWSERWSPYRRSAHRVPP